jgi:hypothetical protein
VTLDAALWLFRIGVFVVTLCTFKLGFFNMGFMGEVDRGEFRPFQFDYKRFRRLLVCEGKAGETKGSKEEDSHNQKRKNTFFHTHLSKNFAYIILKGS